MENNTIKNILDNIQSNPKSKRSFLIMLLSIFLVFIFIIILVTSSHPQLIEEDHGPGDEIYDDSLVFDGRNTLNNYVTNQTSAVVLTQIEDALLNSPLNTHTGKKYDSIISNIQPQTDPSGVYASCYSFTLDIENTIYNIFFQETADQNDIGKNFITTIIYNNDSKYIRTNHPDINYLKTWVYKFVPTSIEIIMVENL